GSPSACSDKSVQGVRVSARRSLPASLRGSALAKGLWRHRCFSPLLVTDPDLLERLISPYGRLSFNEVRRLYSARPIISEIRLRLVIPKLIQLGDRARLRSLERILFGGGLRWEAAYQILIVNEGLDHILDVVLSGGTQDA